MYTVTRAYGRKNRRKDKWVEIDIANSPVRNIQQTWPEMWLFVTYPALQTGEQGLYFEDVVNLTKDATESMTVQQWLTSLGNMTLPLRNTFPTFKERCVSYINAWYGDFEMEPMGPSRRIEPDVSKFDKNDIYIKHPRMTGPELRKKAMISINGFFHFTEYTEDGIIVHYGNRSILHSNMNQIGVHSFYQIGEINYQRINPESIRGKGEKYSLSEGVYVTLDGEVGDLKDKTILFVFNGYLQVLGKGYTRVGNKTFRIQLSNLMMLERFYQARKFMDMEDVPLTEYGISDNLVSVSEFHSDEMIRWLLLRSQTFFVIVDTPSMFHELEPLEHIKIPGRFMDEIGERLPIVGSYGRTLEYRRLRYPNSKFIFATQMNPKHRYDFHTQPWKNSLGVNDGRNSEIPFKHEHAYLRRLGTQD